MKKQKSKPKMQAKNLHYKETEKEKLARKLFKIARDLMKKERVAIDSACAESEDGFLPIYEAHEIIGGDMSLKDCLKWLRLKGFLSAHWAPTEKSRDSDLLRVYEEVDGVTGAICRTVYIAPKAISYFSELLNND